MNPKGKVALVTGSAKRVGGAIALALAREGAHVAVHYLRSENEALKTVAKIKKLGVKSAAIAADLSHVQGAKNLVNEAQKAFGRIDILVHCASIYEKTPWTGIDQATWDRHMDLNLRAAFFLSQTAAIGMKRRKLGKIIHIIDADIERPYPNRIPYLVSKWGLAGLTRCLALELAPEVQVNGISPGTVLLPEGWGSKIRKAIIAVTPLKRIGSPEDIARAVLFCVGSDFMTGSVIPVDGGHHIA